MPPTNKIITGQTSSIRTEYLASLAHQEYQNGCKVCVIDPTNRSNEPIYDRKVSRYFSFDATSQTAEQNRDSVNKAMDCFYDMTLTCALDRHLILIIEDYKIIEDIIKTNHTYNRMEDLIYCDSRKNTSVWISSEDITATRSFDRKYDVIHL